jgi:hypothetical protein
MKEMKGKGRHRGRRNQHGSGMAFGL